MEKILVAYDGSQGSELALLRAEVLIAENPNGRITLMAVVPEISQRTFIDKAAYRNARKRAMRMINETIALLRNHGIAADGVVCSGDVAAEIIRFANDIECDLIVMGCRGKSLIGAYLMGSVADKVVHYAAKPVMVVR
ncbi:MAG: hypothetical protein CVT48_06145 [Thermoplasmata archaeon HGW-Thermoplasmata-1]|nr:MAG: hypothetical protein CVT48_06145 [Thermoplasmata archaeon HGW-Thermoplasmata-1]